MPNTKKTLTSYINNVGKRTGPVGRFTAEIIDVPLEIGSIGIRGVANTINVAKNTVSKETKILGNVLAKSTRVLANTLNIKSKKNNNKKTSKPKKEKK